MLKRAEGNEVICASIEKAAEILPQFKNIACSISGGKDSDIMLDLIWNLDTDKKVRYIWFDTGMEYKATKDHLKYLEDKYNIVIERIKAIKSIPKSVKEYGQPFLNKKVSAIIYSMQKRGFKFEDDTFINLAKKYPGIMSYIRWWTNGYPYDNSLYNIEYNKYLKEFMTATPPQFRISAHCCNYAKKNLSKQFIKDNGIDLMITGIRRAEGGIRSARYTSCFDNENTKAAYRPLFWYSNSDEREYDELFKIEHSDCYEVWGFKRTGCAGCPFNRNVFNDLEIVEKYEPNMANAAKTIFKDSYEYTKAYRDFCKEMKELNNPKKG